jgi:hypothetical protein
MPVEWVAKTDFMVCSKCGKNINEGEVVVGDFDKFFHKNPEDCEESSYQNRVFESR